MTDVATPVGQELEQRDEIALAEEARQKRLPIPTGNGLLAPARWEMFGRIANTVADTEFVPRGLRGNKPAVMACLLYGDAQGLHPSVALSEIHIVDGKPTMSATLMVGKIRMAGHRIKREEIYEDVDGVKTFIGCYAHGTRGDDGETDTFRFDLRMATRAGLMTKHNWKSYPEAMCWARCVSQLGRMLFPDVFLGTSAFTAEELGLAETGDDGMPLDQLETPTAAQLEQAPPAFDDAGGNPPGPPEAPVGDTTVFLEVRDEDGTLVGTYPKGHDPFSALGLDPEEYEIAGVIEHEPGGIIMRPKLVEGEVVHPTEEEPSVEAEAGDAGAEGEAGAEAGEEGGGADAADSAAPDADAAYTAPGAQAQIGALTIPKVMELVVKAKNRGDVEFIRGVLAAENAKAQPRARLVSSLEDEIAELEELARRDKPAPAETRRPVEGREPDALPETEEPAAPAVPAFSVGGGPRAVPDPEPAPRLAAVKVRAVCAWMEEHKPEEKSWRYEAIVAAANHIYGSLHADPIHALEDLTDEELEQIWGAAPAPAKEALAILEPADLAQLAKHTLGPKQ